MNKYYKLENAILEVISGDPNTAGLVELPEMSGLGEEKHKPIITKTDRGYLVTVSTVEHPMLPEHYIEWIELRVGRVLHRVQLSPDDKPEYAFLIGSTDEDVSAAIYCNIHGLWLS